MSADTLKVYIPAIALALLGFALAYQFVDPAPPSSLTFSAGQKGGAYYAYAERYKIYLRQRGITVNILESAGSMQNIERLTEHTADIAFVQSGMIQAGQSQLLSLGSMYFEPLWVFVRHDLDIRFLSDLKGKRIAVGMVGSGTRALALQLLKNNGIDESTASLIAMGSSDAVQAMRHAELDAVFIVSAASNAAVQSLQQSNAVRLLNIRRAEAGAAR